MADVGIDTNTRKQWMIIKKSEGMHITKTSAYQAVRGNEEKCEALLKHAAKLATATTLELYKKTGWDQNDLNSENVLFDDKMSKAYLIDWGMAKRLPEAVSAAAYNSDIYIYTDCPLSPKKQRSRRRRTACFLRRACARPRPRHREVKHRLKGKHHRRHH